MSFVTGSQCSVNAFITMLCKPFQSVGICFNLGLVLGQCECTIEPLTVKGQLSCRKKSKRFLFSVQDMFPYDQGGACLNGNPKGKPTYSTFKGLFAWNCEKVNEKKRPPFLYFVFLKGMGGDTSFCGAPETLFCISALGFKVRVDSLLPCLPLRQYAMNSLDSPLVRYLLD